MNRICVLFGTLFLLCSFAFAFDISIDSVILPVNPNAAQPQTFFLTLTNHESDTNTFNLKLYQGNTTITNNVFQLIGFETRTFNFDANLLVGNRHYDLNIESLIDNNSQNNDYPFDLNVLRGPDPSASTINLSAYNIRARQSLHITANLTNLGDQNLVLPFIARIMHNNEQLYQATISTLNVAQTIAIETDYNVPSDLNNGQMIYLKLDNEQNSPDFDRTNNVSSTSFSVTGDIDLSIDSSDINFTDPLRVGYQTKVDFAVRNIGGQPMQNVLIRIWHTTKTTDTILYSSNVSFDLGEKKVLSFYYTPQTIGADTFYFEIDSLHDLNEPNRINNSVQKSFTVLTGLPSTDANGYFYSKNITVRGECFILFNNNDKLLTLGIRKVEPNALEYCVDFKYTDSWGTELVHKECARANDSFNLNGRTITVLSVNSSYANFFTVFSTPVTDFYSNCQVDTGALANTLETCQSDLKTKLNDLEVCKQVNDAQEGGYSQALTNSEQCRGQLSDCQYNLTTANSTCDTRVSTKDTEKTNECDTQLNQLSENINQLEKTLAYSDFIGTLGWVFFFVLLVGGTATWYFFIFRGKQR